MKSPLTILAITLLLLTLGCSSRDGRLTQLAEHASQRQAEQNRTIAAVTQSASESHVQIVAAVEKSRQDVALLEREVRSHVARIDAERRSLANERHRESLLAPVIQSLGTLLAATLPLVICIYLLSGLRGQSDEEAVSELMIQELLASESPLLIRQTPGSPRLGRLALEQGQPEQLPF